MIETSRHQNLLIADPPTGRCGLRRRLLVMLFVGLAGGGLLYYFLPSQEKDLERMIAEFRKGNVYISKKYINKIFDLLEQDDEGPIERLLAEDKAERLDAKEAT